MEGKNALLQLALTSSGRQISKDKLLGNIEALSQQASALDKAMTEERFYDDSEIKRKREERDRDLKLFLQRQPIPSPIKEITSKPQETSPKNTRK